MGLGDPVIITISQLILMVPVQSGGPALTSKAVVQCLSQGRYFQTFSTKNLSTPKVWG